MIDPLELAHKLARIFPNCEVGDLAAHVIRREEGVEPKMIGIDMAACGNCRATVFRHDNYCGVCGRRLNWPGGEA
jgi:hypothetical protein